MSSRYGQRGELVRRGDNWTVRYYDEQGRRRRKGGFGPGREGKQSARTWLDDRLDHVEGLRRDDGSARARARAIELTLTEAVDRYLAAHEADPVTIAKLRRQLRPATSAFGERTLRSLGADELAAWRKTVSNSHYVFRALRQVLKQGVAWRWLDENPAAAVKNPKPKAPEIRPFASWREVEAIAAELDPRFAAIATFAAGTGLRPEEWIALERRDVDRDAGVVHVRRVYTQGRLKECAKTSRQRRRVPLRHRVLDALESHPPRLDTPLLFPAARGGYIELEKWRRDHWHAAIRAAGLCHCTRCDRPMGQRNRVYVCDGCGAERPSRRIYDLRHTYATWSLAAGVSLFVLSRRMGTSLAMIDATYGHLAADAEDRERDLLDVFDEAVAATP